LFATKDLRQKDFSGLVRDYILKIPKISLESVDKYCIMKAQENDRTKEKKMITLDKVMAAVRQVFGKDSHKVRVIQAGSSFKIEPKDMIHDGVWIRSENQILNNVNALYYDMVCEACADEADYTPGLDDGEF